MYLPDAWPATDLRRRALIVGIDKYEAPDTSDEIKSSIGQAASAKAVQRSSRFHNLDGAVNDAELINEILKDRFGFHANDIIFLRNEQATRDQILRAFQTHLIEAAAPGDISLFYYAGHGSQVRNLASDEADQLDETLVPSDAFSGAPDIRDKEMVRLYRAALKKNILLTVVLDSCHSGGMSRGLWNQGGKTRNLPPDPRAVNDPPDVDPVTGKKLPDPSSMGLLFIAAAREDQPAGETTITQSNGHGEDKEISHGAFTAAFAKVLGSSMGNQSIEQLCDRVQAILAGEGKTQVPTCAGAERGSRDLLNQPAGSASLITLAVESASLSGIVRLRGGSALGLAPGCRLVRTSDSPVRVELTRVDLGTSEAKILGGASSITPPRAGDLFKVETWVASPQSELKVSFAKDGPDASAVLATAKLVNSLAGRDGLQLVSEWMEDANPTHTLFWHEGSYHLEPFPAKGNAALLGAAPSIETIFGALNGASNARLWAMLPPSREIASSIRLGAGTENAAVAVVDDTSACTYLLTGRLNRGALEYSWSFKDAFMANLNRARLPLQSDWTSSAEQLTNMATRLGRVYGWLNLNGPMGGDPAFPYQLAFGRPGKQGSVATGPFRFKERYKFALQATPEALKEVSNSGGVAKRYVYVFLIDSAGNATCFFPDPKNGNDQNRLPRDETSSPWIELTRNEYDIEISEPAGTDNYFLVASEEPLDPGIFQWTGVRRHERTRGKENSLEFLFASAGEGTRGAQAARSVPVTWSIESMGIRTMP